MNLVDRIREDADRKTIILRVIVLILSVAALLATPFIIAAQVARGLNLFD